MSARDPVPVVVRWPRIRAAMRAAALALFWLAWLALCVVMYPTLRDLAFKRAAQFSEVSQHEQTSTKTSD